MSLPAPIAVTEASTPILPAVSARTQATIFNDGLETVFLKWDGSADALTSANGEVLPPKSRVVLDTVHAVTGLCAAGKTSKVRVQDISTP